MKKANYVRRASLCGIAFLIGCGSLGTAGIALADQVREATVDAATDSSGGSQSIDQVFPDSRVAAAVAAALGKTAGDVSTQAELDSLTTLNLGVDAIGGVTPNPASAHSLEGLQKLSNLSELTLGGTYVSDLTPIAGLTSLQKLEFPASKVVDISALAGLTNLTSMSGSYTDVKDLSALSGLAKLETLTLFNTEVESVAPLSNLNKLNRVVIGALVRDFSPMKDLPGLTFLNVRGNQITDPSVFDSFVSSPQLILSNQRITAPSPIVRSPDGDLTFTNPIVSAPDNAITPGQIFDGGVYDGGTNKLTWSETAPLAETDDAVGFEFTSNVTIKGISLTYSGGVTQPVSGIVRTNYVDQNGTAAAPSEDVIAPVGSAYTVAQKAIPGWTYQEVVGATPGLYTNRRQSITYRYERAAGFEVRYDGNGSTGGVVPTDDSVPYPDGNEVTVLAPGTLVRTGYTFKGWATTAGATTAEYQPGDSFAISKNTTLFAVWVADKAVEPTDPPTTQPTTPPAAGHDPNPSGPSFGKTSGTSTGVLPMTGTATLSLVTAALLLVGAGFVLRIARRRMQA